MISFIIPVKNERGYIGGCIESILMQRHVDLEIEIIVVDNNSTDKTAEFVSGKFLNVKIVLEKIPGTSAARNRGFLESRGGILIFLDADVRLPDEQWLVRLLKFFNDQSVVAVSTHYRYYELSLFKKVLQQFGQFVFVYPWLFIMNDVLKITSSIVGGMTVVRRKTLELVGGFETGVKFFGDEASLVLRLYKYGKIVVSPKLWVYTSGRRFQKSGMIRTVFKYVLNYFWVMLFKRPYHS